MKCMKWAGKLQLKHSDAVCKGTPTWDRPRCTDAVSEMYMILPSGATTNMKPSSVCEMCKMIARVRFGNSSEQSKTRQPVVLWHVTPCSLVEVYLSCCPYHWLYEPYRADSTTAGD